MVNRGLLNPESNGAVDQHTTRMDIWERKLLDFSLRNNMLNLYLRQRAIQFMSADVDQLENHLQNGEEYIIKEKPEVDIQFDTEEKLFCSKMYPELNEMVRADIQNHCLHSYHAVTETKNTLKNIYRAARNAIEESGANSLFLAMGVLRWYETETSDNARFAPILMLPVEMVYKKGAYYVRTRDEEIILNVTLIEFLRQNFDIKIPGLSPLPKDEQGVDVQLIFSTIREALKEQERWDVVEESILGVFSFNKFLMWNDIHNHRDELIQNKVIESLVQQRLTWQPEPLSSTLKENDKKLRPDQLALPVPVDSSQMAAIYEAGLGHSFILYGPPGTGKSQTITNLIANALFQGKRVLFVAEKMAALSVVQSRLAKIGLDPFCLEMHSNKVTKRHVLEQFAKALNVTHIVSPEEYSRTADKLYQQRKKLIEYMEALHENRGEDGFSLYDCILRYEQNNSQPFDQEIMTDDFMQAFNVQTVDEYEHLLGGRLESVMSIVGQPSQHNLRGLKVSQADVTDVSAFTEKLKRSQQVLQTDNDLSHTKKLRKDILNQIGTVEDGKDADSVLSEDAKSLYREWREVRVKWFIPQFFAKRRFMKKIRQFAPYIIYRDAEKLLTDMINYQEQHEEIGSIHEVARTYFDKNYDTDILPSKEEMEMMSAQFSTWIDNMSDSRDWCQWCDLRKELIDKKLGTVVDIIETQNIDAADVLPRTMKTIFRDIAKRKISQAPMLRMFEGRIFDETVALYKKLTTDFQVLSQKELYAKLAAQIPHVTNNIDSGSEIGFLNRNISNGGRGISMRDLIDHIPTLINHLCPCMLMSPMSVAQYLSLSQDKFDLVIFDEASQMPTSEAVGAIARGKSLIVVGDPKQMPPTTFFASANVDEDEVWIDDMESILEDCRTLEFPSLQLNWHYRSQHESLIAFSNNEYYDGSLITFPSVDDQKTKVRYVPVTGVYDKGASRSNITEAEAIVKEIERRLTDQSADKQSIGVIAFSVAQQNLIEDLLQAKLESDKSLREAADALYERIFVKNLENVQGDERDVVLFSIGYGPDKSGKVSMNFGPLNNKGGERRLNVAVSRARQEMIVFATLRSADIDLRRSNAKGVEGLKHFLEYAEQQILVQNENTVHEESEKCIAQQIAQALKDKGYMAYENIGRSQFKVDVAITRKDNPDVYLLGILLDGEGYRNTQTTRDREIVQPSVLTNLHWQVMRVWSVDWFNNPGRVISRIIEKIEQAEKNDEVVKEEQVAFDISSESVEKVSTNLIEYRECADKDVKLVKDFLRVIRKIVEIEQPINSQYLARRFTILKGFDRGYPNLQKSIIEMAEGNLYVQNDRKVKTIWLNEKSAQSYVSYRPNNGRDILEVPMAEIKNAVLDAINEQFSIPTDSLTLVVAKMLGYSRRGSNLDEAFTIAIKELCDEGKIQEKNGILHKN